MLVPGGAHLKQKVLLSVARFGKQDYLFLLTVHTGDTVRFSQPGELRPVRFGSFGSIQPDCHKSWDRRGRLHNKPPSR